MIPVAFIAACHSILDITCSRHNGEHQATASDRLFQRARTLLPSNVRTGGRAIRDKHGACYEAGRAAVLWDVGCHMPTRQRVFDATAIVFAAGWHRASTSTKLRTDSGFLTERARVRGLEFGPTSASLALGAPGQETESEPVMRGSSQNVAAIADKWRDHRHQEIGLRAIGRVAPSSQPQKSTPGRIRTSDLRIRSPLLYPAELWARKWAFSPSPIIA